MTLAEFLLARIAEDERTARSVRRMNTISGPLMPEVWHGDERVYVGGHPISPAEYNQMLIDCSEPADPDARVLAECDAKRRIVTRIEEYDRTHISDDFSGELLAEDVLCLLALPYADHPDYREEWRP